MIPTKGQRATWLGEDGPLTGIVVATSPFHAWIDWSDGAIGIHALNDARVRFEAA